MMSLPSMYFPAPVFLDHKTALAYLLQLTNRTDASGDELAAAEEYVRGVNGLERAIEQFATMLNNSQMGFRSMLVELAQQGANWRQEKAGYPFASNTYLDKDLAVASMFQSTDRADVGGDERDAAVEFVQEVNGLEVVCERAASYLRATQSDFRSFLNAFRQRRIDLRCAYPDENLRALIAVISLSIDAVGQASSDAVTLLCAVVWTRLSHIPEEFAPFLWYRNHYEIDPASAKREAALERERKLDLLASHALILRRVDRCTFEVDPLVEADLQNRIMESERPAFMMLIIMATFYLFSPRYADSDVQECSLPLALYCAEQIATGQFDTYEAGGLVHDTAYYLYQK
ncbi:MAG: hypothetical protein JWQ02_3198, partial [Capsulimonas sp.]|nr:hypothetical protein [Capsulimonas sp.]